VSFFFYADAKRATNASPMNAMNQTAHSAPMSPPTPALKCDEPHCRSKAIFKTPDQLRRHIKNRHRQPLLCPWPGCTHRSPCGTACDLSRHVNTKHRKVRDFTCPLPDCSAHVNGFSRKDKLLAHLRDKHTMFHCPVYHCGDIVPDGAQQIHMDGKHPWTR
jgi:hypothetical protein